MIPSLKGTQAHRAQGGGAARHERSLTPTSAGPVPLGRHDAAHSSLGGLRPTGPALHTVGS